MNLHTNILNTNNMAKNQVNETITLLADIAEMLISNGSNTPRVSRNVNRIANALGFQTEIFFSYSAVIITLIDPVTGYRETIVKNVSGYDTQFMVISDISILSWHVVEKNLTIDKIREELIRIKKIRNYKPWLVFTAVSLAGGGLVKIFGGSNFEFLVAFVGTLLGIVGQQFFIKKQFNVFLTTFAGSFISTAGAAAFKLFGFTDINIAIISSVLWLIPGVLLINGFIDAISGFVVSGFAKVTAASIHLFMIAFAFFTALLMF